MTTLALVRIDLSVPDVQKAAKNIIAKEAPEAEYAVFLHIAMGARLNPFNGEIYLIKTSNGYKPYISLKGMLQIAERDYKGIYQGFSPFKKLYQDQDGAFNTERRGKLFSVTAAVYRKDRKFPIEYEALFSSYYKPSSSHHVTYPELALSEKALRQALIFSFPVPELGSSPDETTEAPIELDDSQDVNEETLPIYKEPLPLPEVKDEILEKVIEEPKERPSPAPSQIAAMLFTEAMPLRVEFQRLLNEIHRFHKPETSLDVLASKAMKESTEFHHIAGMTDVSKLKSAVAYCQEFLSKSTAKKVKSA